VPTRGNAHCAAPECDGHQRSRPWQRAAVHRAAASNARAPSQAWTPGPCRCPRRQALSSGACEHHCWRMEAEQPAAAAQRICTGQQEHRGGRGGRAARGTQGARARRGACSHRAQRIAQQLQQLGSGSRRALAAACGSTARGWQKCAAPGGRAGRVCGHRRTPAADGARIRGQGMLAEHRCKHPAARCVRSGGCGSAGAVDRDRRAAAAVRGDAPRRERAAAAAHAVAVAGDGCCWPRRRRGQHRRRSAATRAATVA
jgi:hypothetical protein